MTAGKKTICAFLLLASWALAGCETPKPISTVTTTTPSARYLGTETVKQFETKVFLECIEPESTEMQARKLSRSDMERSDYYSDRANKDQPSLLAMPEVYTVTKKSLDQLVESGDYEGAFITLQVRERTRVLRAKAYELTASVVDENNERSRKFLDRVQFPRYYDWAWNPNRIVNPSRRIEFVALEWIDRRGVSIKGEGLMDDNGMIQFDLRPYLEAGAASPDGLLFSFSCYSVGTFCKVRVEREVFESLR